VTASAAKNSRLRKKASVSTAAAPSSEISSTAAI
jgi:hypothetical protein